jgi:magnesium chelatase family protein
MLATVGAIALVGLDAHPVRVECSSGPGLPTTRLVGLPDSAVREAGDRVKTAVQRSDLSWPDARVVVNLAPADLRKSGTGFDLPIAVALLAATGQIPPERLDGVWAVGELGLDGRTRPVPGILPIAAAAARAGARWLLVPDRGAPEAALVEDLEVVPVSCLSEVVAVLKGDAKARRPDEPGPAVAGDIPDLIDVRGQPLARRAVEIAAAGGHHVLLAGPPGCGKSMLAERLAGLLPPLTLDAALEVAAIHSVAGIRAPDAPLSLAPPFRAPHHTTSAAGLIGGGAGIPRPGELSLAHQGILFVDELLEVPRWILDALRQPLESGTVAITRASAAVRYPARVLLVAATNPCPCGHLGDTRRACTCRPDRIERYRARLSGPLLDRIDLQVSLTPVEPDALAAAPDGEATAPVAARVLAARAAAAERWGPGTLVRDAHPDLLRRHTRPATLARLARAVEGLQLSARAFDRCLRVARTVADLEGTSTIDDAHVDEAIAYRLPDAVALT